MIKQYVNLPKDPNEPRHGNEVTLEANSTGLNKLIGRAEWTIEPGGNNTDKKYLAANERAELDVSVGLSNAGKFRNTLFLPHVGGDKYKVRCYRYGSDLMSGKVIEEIETWRKLYYTIHAMGDKAKSMFGKMQKTLEDEYKVHFIELEHKGTIDAKIEETATGTIGKDYSMSHLYDKVPELPNKPHHMRFLLVNKVYIGKEQVDIVTGKSRVFDHTITDDLATRGAIINVCIRKKQRKHTTPDKGWIDITGSAKKTSKNNIQINVGSRFDKVVPKGKPQEKSTYQLYIKYLKCRYINGYSHGNFCVSGIERSGTDAQIQKSVVSTMVHEVGHGCQQVVKEEKLYDGDGNDTKKVEKNPKWHTNINGGQGPHCSTNAKLVEVTPAAGGKPAVKHYKHDSGVMCVMYFAGSSKKDSKFCGSCKPRLKRVNLDESNMKNKNWDLY